MRRSGVSKRYPNASGKLVWIHHGVYVQNPLAVGRDRYDGGQVATVADTQAGLTIDGGNLESSMLAPDFLSQKDDVPGDRLGTDDGRARWTT